MVALALVLSLGGVASAATLFQCRHDQTVQATCCCAAHSKTGTTDDTCCCDVSLQPVPTTTEAATNHANQLAAYGATLPAAWSPSPLAAGAERWIGARGSGADPVPILLLTKSFLI